jgi:hypothetical protein
MITSGQAGIEIRILADQLVHCFAFLLCQVAKDAMQLADQESEAARAVTPEMKQLIAFYRENCTNVEAPSVVSEGEFASTAGMHAELMQHPPLSAEGRKTLISFYTARPKVSDNVAATAEVSINKAQPISRTESRASNSSKASVSRAKSTAELPIVPAAELPFDGDAASLLLDSDADFVIFDDSRSGFPQPPAAKGGKGKGGKNPIRDFGQLADEEDGLIFVPPEWQQTCIDIIKRIAKHEFVDAKNAKPGGIVIDFFHPVIDLYPNIREAYLAVIKEPMDLSTVAGMLDLGQFATPSEFAEKVTYSSVLFPFIRSNVFKISLF